MVRAHVCVLVGLGLMLSAASTAARQLEFFVENRLVGSDNVSGQAQNSARNPRADGFWEIAPRVTVRETLDERSYDIRYQPSFEKYFAVDQLSGWDHNAVARADWALTPTDRLGVDGSFASNRRLREEFLDLGIDPDPALEPTDRQRIRRSRAALYYSRSFNQRLSARLDYRFDDLDYNRRDVSDSRSQTASLGMEYSPNQRTAVGVTGSLRHRNSRVNQTLSNGVVFREVRNSSRTVDVSFSLRREIAKTLDVSIQAGPSIIETQQDVAALVVLVPRPPPKSHSNDLSFFAAASIRKTFRDAEMTLSYSRFESGGGGSVTSSISDSVTGSAIYRVDRWWVLRAFASWSRRKQFADDVSVGGDEEITHYRVVGSLTRKFTPRLALTGRVQYRVQSQKAPGDDPVTETLSGWIALRFSFDPIVF
ncbi:MAG: hypothetical protein GY910_11280 [bacterium]|nr:hypothetical protein [bacterium]